MAKQKDSDNKAHLDLVKSLSAVSLDLAELTTHFNLFERICYTFAAVCSAVLGWLLLSYIPNQFGDKLPSNFKERFDKLEGNTATLQKSNDRLLEKLLKITPTSLNEIIPYPEKSPPAKLVSSAFQQAAHVLDASLRVQLPANTAELAPVAERVTKLSLLYPRNPAVQEAANSLQVRLAAYDVFSRSEQDAREALLRGERPKGIYKFIASLTLQCTPLPGLPQPYAIRSSTQAAIGIALFYVRIRTCSQNLDGFKYVGVDFVDSTIGYHGGPLDMAKTTFENCKFDFGDDERSQAVLRAIKASNGKPVTLFLRGEVQSKIPLSK